MSEASRDAGVRLPGVVAWPLVGISTLALVWAGYQFGQWSAPPRITSSGPRIEEIRKIAKLAVLRVQVANVLEGTNAGGRAAVLVKGDADIALDLDRIRIADRDDARRTATLILPEPRPDRPRVDHERTRLYQLEKTGLAALNPFADPRAEILADVMRAAQAEVERAVQDAEFITQAREQAELLLTGFYREMGWTVRIQWGSGAPVVEHTAANPGAPAKRAAQL